VIQYQNTVLKAQQEVENGPTDTPGSPTSRLAAAERRGGQQGPSRRARSYLLGTRDFTTVLTAEQKLYQAQSNLATASGNLSTSLASLYRSLGGGWQIREGATS
jgi:outer membrane protein TolC